MSKNSCEPAWNNAYYRATCELQNQIHAIDVQIREAMHIRDKYTNIKKSLKEDSDKFDSNIKMLEEELCKQKVDIKKLEKIMKEATRMRSIARANLLREEREVNKAMAEREREAAEGRKLVNDRKIELERLERKLFQGGRISARPEPQVAEDPPGPEEKPPTPPHPVEEMAQKFEILKRATGGTSPEDVLQRFKSQRQTHERLMFLKNKAESEKNKLESKLEGLKMKLESLKYVEVQEAEGKGAIVDSQEKIQEYQRMSKASRRETEKTHKAMNEALAELQNLHLAVNTFAKPERGGPRKMNEDVEEMLGRVDVVDSTTDQDQSYDSDGDKWLPALYTGLVRKTPLPQSESSPAPPPAPDSEDEEDVPSRGYLKRQAQLVVDAKSRRKNIKIQLPRRT